MGSVRGRDFEAVIGVGGTGDEPRDWGIAEKLNWIGIGPHRSPGSRRGPLVTFDRFLSFGDQGPMLRDHAPALARHIYGMNVRTLMTFTEQEQKEVDRILAMAKGSPPSEALGCAARPGSKKQPKPSPRRC